MKYISAEKLKMFLENSIIGKNAHDIIDNMPGIEPCDDAISRAAALESFEITNTRPGAKHAIETLPPVKPALPITGKWTPDNPSDNRGAEPKDISDEHYHVKFDTVTCPHCGCTLANHVVVGGWYCYHCGGKFGKKDITCDGCDAQYTSRCDCEEGHYEAKTFDCNDCALCMANCHDMSIACETEEGKCDWFELWEGDNGTGN